MAEDGDISGIIDAMDPNLGANIGQESSLSNWVGPYVTDMLGMGQALAETPYPSYEGTLTAPISSLQDQAFGGIAGLSVPYEMGETADLALGVGEKAAGMEYDPTDYAGEIGRWTDEGVAESYMNPFIAQALTPQLEEMRRQAEIQRHLGPRTDQRPDFIAHTSPSSVCGCLCCRNSMSIIISPAPTVMAESATLNAGK